MADDPAVLRLPPWMATRFDLARVLAEDGRWTWSEAHRLLERFALSGPEIAFARAVLSRRRNLWLYRCNQRLACGDFIVIDLSVPTPRARPVWVVELKADGPVALGGARRQLAGHPIALAELAGQGVIDASTPAIQVHGGAAAVLAYLGM